MRTIVRKILYLPILFIMTGGMLSAQTAKKDVLDIRRKYNQIRNNLDSLETKYVHELSWSVEGGDAIAYTKDDQVIMIRATWFGEIVKGEYEYYYSEGKLIFAFYTDYRYNRPIYYTKEVAEKHNDEAFDPSKTVVSESRYYFKDRILFRWLNDERERVDVADYGSMQKEILEASDELVNRFNK